MFHSDSMHVPSIAAAIHLLCRVELKPDLNFSSRESADRHFQRESNLGLVQKFSEGLPPRANKSQSLLATEFIPYALWMLSAGTGSASLSRAASSIFGEMPEAPEPEGSGLHEIGECDVEINDGICMSVLDCQ